ncbi:MAG: response regulator transcription factor [Candidatus Midichloria sp.]|nr:response regulator transcription factor [Candidatus Midichloria sp.]
MTGSHILIVDDDFEIRSLLSELLIKNSFIVSTAKDTEEADKLLQLIIFDLIILDVMMPKESGIQFLTRMKKNQPPIIMLTAMADIDDRINGLELGAADYLAKPFEVKELILRIKNLLCRKTSYTQVVRFGPYEFDLDKNSLTCQKSKIHLTTNESKLLNILAKKYGRIVAREEIVLNNEEELTERAVDAQVARLRNKIEKKPKNPLYLHTIRNKGYMLRET